MELFIDKSNPNVAIVKVGKRLDFQNSAVFKAKCMDAVTKGAKIFIVDFTDTGLLDSTGISAMFSITSRIMSQQGRLVLASVSRPVQVIVQLTRLHKAFKQFDTVNDALDALTKPKAVN